ncbi:Uncharacterised protein [Plesiomonas shigelloides]|nr:Uncharacterised protein [Plesiomonas shigelloides]
MALIFMEPIIYLCGSVIYEALYAVIRRKNHYCGAPRYLLLSLLMVISV